MSCPQTLHDLSGYEVKAWKTHGIGLPCVKVVGLGVLHLTQTKPTQFGGGRKTVRGQERKKEERERKKGRKEGSKEGRKGEERKKKRRRSWYTLQQGRFFSY